ncbi:MAG: cytochrome ubiquinol oxidase subunit I [Desulfobulbaceae bacterium]|uniref:Cytochrome ubiquinol oxidase subunit I n=1 Tax=Candidatus Desulfobia pelagia TaxID=2841692 RepID=A0A8J6NE25_9BACT|nr:cytochrome ubiquinol oxidase subunit I [Candidatus Desulfobia pelagia]
MNYPVWSLDFAGGGLLIAMMAIFHVYISHFAIGGGLFLVLTERKGLRENSQAILDYTRKHTKFFLILTLVFGTITGVGIWFTIALLNPAATSKLIHTFVFAWAVEWVFFSLEIVSIFIYFYTFGRMDPKKHQLIGWLYFIFGWLSLFVINGIIGFMLTPGFWIETGNFWDGFFNPTFWPALFFRTFLALMIAGLFGFLTSSMIKEESFRLKMVRYCSLWLLIPIGLFLVSGWWYLTSTPAHVQEMIIVRMPELKPFLTAFQWLTPILILGGLLMAVRMPRPICRAMAVVLLVVGILYMGAFEFIREGGRRPYILYDYMYSNSILKEDYPKVRETGVLQEAKWVINKEITSDNTIEAGKELFTLLCMPCHSQGGVLNDILPLTAKYDRFGMNAMLTGIGKVNRYMPPFAGNDKERDALAAYIVHRLHGKELTEGVEVDIISEKDVVPPFNGATDEYVLLAWNTLGVHDLTDADNYWSFHPPGNDIFAQLIKRGEVPEVVSAAVVVSYAVEKAFRNPSDHVPFWNNTSSLLGRMVPSNTGLTGNGLTGIMKYGQQGAFVAEGVPVTPYPDGGGYQPYPKVTIEARDQGGALLASTQVVVPVSTEMGCKNCHGGPWRVDGRAGFSDKTAADILATHDRISKTDLLARAESGDPVLCQSCHLSTGKKALGNQSNLSLSAAIHGFHANYLSDREDDACNACHPNNSTGSTHFMRGIHKAIGLTCVECHGYLEDHALSLLKKEMQLGREKAAYLMENLSPRSVESIQDVQPRSPWVNEPDCLNCHVDFQPPEVVATFNEWTDSEEGLYRNRKEISDAIFCAACHGSPHALYPAENPYGQNRDVLQPMQYQNLPYPVGSNKNCSICHTIDMEEDFHHPNSFTTFRNE